MRVSKVLAKNKKAKLKSKVPIPTTPSALLQKVKQRMTPRNHNVRLEQSRSASDLKTPKCKYFYINQDLILAKGMTPSSSKPKLAKSNTPKFPMSASRNGSISKNVNNTENSAHKVESFNNRDLQTESRGFKLKRDSSQNENLRYQSNKDLEASDMSQMKNDIIADSINLRDSESDLFSHEELKGTPKSETQANMSSKILEIKPEGELFVN